MAEHIVDCMITKIYKGPGGEGEYGPYQVYNIYLNKGDDKKFGYIQSGKKPIPTVGMGIKHLEYEIKKEGQYTNYKVKTLELVEDEPINVPASVPSKPVNSPQANGNKDASFYVAYAKDIQVSLITANPKGYMDVDLNIIAKLVVNVGLMMANMVSGNTPEKPSDAPESQKSDEPIQEPTQEPQEDKPWTTRKEFIKEIKTFAERLGTGVYDNIITEHKADLLNNLSPEKGLILYLALREEEMKIQASGEKEDNIPF